MLFITLFSLFVNFTFASSFSTLLQDLRTTDIASTSAILSYECYDKTVESREGFISSLKFFDDSTIQKMTSGDLFIRNQKIQADKIVAHFANEEERHYLNNSEVIRVGIFKIDVPEKKIYISFTGTYQIFDWLKNAGVNKKTFEFFGKNIETAEGFYSACSDRLEILFPLLDEQISRLEINPKEFQFILSGHSLGGAIAALATFKIYEHYDLHLRNGIFNSNNQVKLITFGCPKYLFRESDMFIGIDNALRIRHAMDGVPNAIDKVPYTGVLYHFGHKLELALPLWYENGFCKVISAVRLTANHSMKQYLLSVHATIHDQRSALVAKNERRRETLEEVYEIVCLKIYDMLRKKISRKFKVTWAHVCDSVTCYLNFEGHSNSIPLIEFGSLSPGSSSVRSAFAQLACEHFITAMVSFATDFPSPSKLTTLALRRVAGEDGSLTNFVPIANSKIHEMLLKNYPKIFNALFVSHSPSVVADEFDDDEEFDEDHICSAVRNVPSCMSIVEDSAATGGFIPKQPFCSTFVSSSLEVNDSLELHLDHHDGDLGGGESKELYAVDGGGGGVSSQKSSKKKGGKK